jgi:hypothetical protein
LKSSNVICSNVSHLNGFRFIVYSLLFVILLFVVLLLTTLLSMLSMLSATLKFEFIMLSNVKLDCCGFTELVFIANSLHLCFNLCLDKPCLLLNFLLHLLHLLHLLRLITYLDKIFYQRYHLGS